MSPSFASPGNYGTRPYGQSITQECCLSFTADHPEYRALLTVNLFISWFFALWQHDWCAFIGRAGT
jgi:hypothetical protein